MSLLHEAQRQWEPALASFKRHAQVQQALLHAQAETAAQVLTARMEAERNRLQAELLHLRNAELERNMRQLADQAEQFARDAQHDPLTGLGNRRHFAQRIAALREAARAAGGHDVVLMMADIDFFKRINDGFSHAVGDEVLRHVGALLRKHSRPYDLVARFGGEEFVIAFGSGLGLAQAQAVAERIRECVAAHAWHELRAGLAVTVSLGLAQARPGEPIEHTIERADAALYRAKGEGRNRVCAAAG
jgi:diguanylate cyclase (GGDEF)-like protein